MKIDVLVRGMSLTRGKMKDCFMFPNMYDTEIELSCTICMIACCGYDELALAFVFMTWNGVFA